MKSGLFKRVLAVGMIGLLLAGDVPQVLAQSVGDKEVARIGSIEENTYNESATVSGNDLADVSNDIVRIENVVGADETEVVGVNGEENENVVMNANIHHYLGSKSESNMIFIPDNNISITMGEAFSFARGGEYFAVSKVTLNDVEVALEADGSLCIETMPEMEEGQSAAIDVYYTVTESDYRNATTMFDYVNGTSSNSESINYYKNYSNYEPLDAERDDAYDRADLLNDKRKWNTRLGTKGAQANYRLMVEPYPGAGILANANGYNDFEDATVQKDTYPIIKGLLQGLSGEDYENVHFTYYDPGFFTNEIKNGKTVYDGFELGFDRSGIEYTLKDVTYQEGVVCSDLNHFFPLNQFTPGDTNEYFGMRYDFTFSILDYIGKMEYEFRGDDDLWVCMDGKVILDLGGIHGAFPGGTSATEQQMYPQVTYADNMVDIWEVILKKENPTIQDKIDYLAQEGNAEKVHTITVLLMERGGTASTCEMKFEIPYVRSKEEVITRIDPAKLDINKVDAADNTVIGGVTFTLTDSEGMVITATTDEAGNASFTHLEEGVYTLAETTPEGYCVDGPWAVTVKSKIEDNALIYYVEGMVNTRTGQALTAVQNLYTITNTRADIQLVQNKAAELVDWDARLYKITLTASSQVITDTAQGTMTAIHSAQVVDTIDGHFVVTDASGNVLNENAEIVDGAGNTGYLRKAVDGSQYVEWTAITIPVAEGNQAGWNATIYVKAKEDFIGGNMVPTNGANSGITVEEEWFGFDKPTVNVKLRDLIVDNGEITLFKGEEITPGAYLEELAGTIGLVENANDATEGLVLAGAPIFTQEQLGELLSNRTLTVAYSYAGEEMGSFTYEVVSDHTLDNHKATVVGENVEQYTLQVTYNAASIADRSAVLQGYELPETNEETAGFDGVEVIGSNTVNDAVVPAEGVYKIHVVAGSLSIKKTLDTTNVDFTQGDPIFTFKVMKDGVFYSYHTVRFVEGMTDEVQVAVLTDLEKGVYTVEECSTMRYGLEGVTASGVADKAADAAVNSGKAVFGIGRTIENQDTQLNNQDGEAGFTNKKNNQRNLSDTDVVVNTFRIGEDGSISWTADTLEGEE